MMEDGFIKDTFKRVKYYKELGDKTFAQLDEEDLFYKPTTESNSIAVIVQHMHGNMLSRWTNFLTEDGEKEWRARDAEFDETKTDKTRVLALWEEGWTCFLSALESLKPGDLTKTITIRTEPLLVFDAIIRQIAHYPYHVGQIVYLGRMAKNDVWKSLSIPRGDSAAYLESVKQAQQNK